MVCLCVTERGVNRLVRHGIVTLMLVKLYSVVTFSTCCQTNFTRPAVICFCCYLSAQRSCILTVIRPLGLQGGPKKWIPGFYFWDNFGNSAPILTILSLLQAEIYGA